MQQQLATCAAKWPACRPWQRRLSSSRPRDRLPRRGAGVRGGLDSELLGCSKLQQVRTCDPCAVASHLTVQDTLWLGCSLHARLFVCLCASRHLHAFTSVYNCLGMCFWMYVDDIRDPYQSVCVCACIHIRKCV